MPGLELEQWLALTATVSLCRCWFVARDMQGYIRGICYATVRVEGELMRQLEIPLIAAISLAGRGEVLTALFSAAKKMAAVERCRTIHVWTAVPPNWQVLADYLDHGPADHGIIYRVGHDPLPDQPILPVKM